MGIPAIISRVVLFADLPTKMRNRMKTVICPQSTYTNMYLSRSSVFVFPEFLFYSVSIELNCNKNLSPDYSIQRAKSGQGIIIDDNFQWCNTHN